MEQNGTTAESGISIIDYYTSLLMSYDLRQKAGNDPALIKQRLQRYTTHFLDRIKVQVDAFSDDSRSLLLHLIDETSTEAMISAVLGALPFLQRLNYADIALVLEAVRSYSKDELKGVSLEPSEDPEQIKALHTVTHALRFITDDSAISGDTSPMEGLHSVIGNRTVYRIRGKELLAFTVKHAKRGAVIARLIREHGEANLPALRSVLENGPSNAYQLTSEELYKHLDTLAQRPEVRGKMNTNYRYTKDNLKRGVSFLNRILPIINQNTEDSRSLLLNLLEKSSDEDIQRAIDTQPLLKGLTYKDTAKVLESLKWCEQLDSPDAVRSNPDQLVALHLITKAVASMIGDRAISNGHDLVAMTGAFIDTDSVYVLKDKGLIDIALNHPEHAESIADMITSSGTVHYPAIMFLLQGGTKPLSEGAL